MMEKPQTIEQAIESITVWNGNSNMVDVGAYEPEAYRVGFDNVTRIEAIEKPGEYCMLPYVRVWTGDVCLAEFSQHKIVGVYFSPTSAAAEPIDDVVEPYTPPGGWPADHVDGPGCTCDECIPF